MFVLVVVILILIYVIVFDDVFPFITTLFSSDITLLIPYNNNSGGCDGLPVALSIKLNVCSLDDYNPNTYNLPI